MGVVVHHVADDELALLEVIVAIATGRPAPVVTRESLDERNAEHARRFALCTKEETLALLRRNGATMAETIRNLDDDQLLHSGVVLGREVSVAQLAGPVLLGHIQGHLESINATG